MNMQSLMKQVQSMQKQMLDSKSKIEAKTFEGNSELVKVEMNGKREVLSVKIKNEELSSDDLEILEDMIVIATNDALRKIEKEINDNLGRQAGSLGGLL